MDGKNVFIAVLVCAGIVFTAKAYASDVMSQEARVYFEEGVKAQKQNNLDEAIKGYTKTRIMDQGNPQYEKAIINNMGVMYMRSGDVERAEKAFTDALAIDSNYRIAQLNLGLIKDRRMSELDSLKYWLKVNNINVTSLKPKDFMLEDLSKEKK